MCGKKMNQIVERFNERHPIGTEVDYWPVRLADEPVRSRTRSVAFIFDGHTPVVFVNDQSIAIALSHVRPVGKRKGPR